jgi:hypothetical protein
MKRRDLIKALEKMGAFSFAMEGGTISIQTHIPNSLSPCLDITKSMRTWQKPSSKNSRMPEPKP